MRDGRWNREAAGVVEVGWGAIQRAPSRASREGVMLAGVEPGVSEDEATHPDAAAVLRDACR